MAIEQHPGTGQAGRLVRFLAGVYNGSQYPFDLTDLRTLDTELANACIDYLNYDQLGKTEVRRHLPGGGTFLKAGPIPGNLNATPMDIDADSGACGHVLSH